MSRKSSAAKADRNEPAAATSDGVAGRPVKPSRAPVEPSGAPCKPSGAPCKPSGAPVKPSGAPVAPAPPTVCQLAADQTVSLRRSKLDTGRLQKVHASLIVVEGAEIGRDYRLKRSQMLIGRGTECDIKIVDDLASREHARIEGIWDPRAEVVRYRLADLQSTNHVYVNTRRVDRAELQEGDKIQIGDTVLKFVLLDDVDARFHEEVRHRISYDSLTGLLTRQSFFLALETELKRCSRYQLPLDVLMMDLDRFKSVNDTHGHLMGSQVLTEVGLLIRESLRRRDVSGRYGGEEFISYLSEVRCDEALAAAERVRRAIEIHPFTMDGNTIQVTISIGVAHFPDHGADVKQLVARADRALYDAKEAGRNRSLLASHA